MLQNPDNDLLPCISLKAQYLTDSSFYASVLLLIMNFIITSLSSCRSTKWMDPQTTLTMSADLLGLTRSMWIYSAITLWIHSYFDNVMTKFIGNNRRDAWKTAFFLFFYYNKSSNYSQHSLCHVTVVCFLIWPLDSSEVGSSLLCSCSDRSHATLPIPGDCAGGGLPWIQTSLLLSS